MKLKVGSKIKFTLEFPLEDYEEGDVVEVTSIKPCDSPGNDKCCRQCGELIGLNDITARCWGIKDDETDCYIIPFEKYNDKIESRIERLKSV